LVHKDHAEGQIDGYNGIGKITFDKETLIQEGLERLNVTQVEQDKRRDPYPSVKVYLATPYFNDVQVERVEKASEALKRNPTVEVVHFPFDFQYKNATEDSDENSVFGTPEWQGATYQNDLSAMATADAGVFLYDLDNIDDGTAFEIGFMRALHKPAIIVLQSEEDLDDKELNLMIAQGGTSFITDIDDLATYDFNHFPSNPIPPVDVY